MRRFLPVGIGTVLGVVFAPDERAEFAVVDLETGCTASAIIRRDENAACAIDGTVAGAFTGGVLR